MNSGPPPYPNLGFWLDLLARFGTASASDAERLAATAEAVFKGEAAAIPADFDAKAVCLAWIISRCRTDEDWLALLLHLGLTGFNPSPKSSGAV